MANLTSESLWSGIQAIGSEDGTADKTPPAAIAKLIELKFVHAAMQYNGGMDTTRHAALVATLARIDEQIVTFDTLLLKPLSARERVRVTDELAYLKVERRISAATLPKIH